MRHLARLFLIVFLLAGLAVAPAASFAAPQGHEMHPAMMADMDASMHAHHMMMQTEKVQPAEPGPSRRSCSRLCRLVRRRIPHDTPIGPGLEQRLALAAD